MPKLENASRIYEAFDRFKDRCLLQDLSLIWPTDRVWHTETLGLVRKRFIDEPIWGGGTFEEKITAQFTPLPESCWKLLADALYVYCLPSIFMKPSTKYELITSVVAPHVKNIPPPHDPIWKPLDEGFTRTSYRYHSKYGQLSLIFLFAAAIKGESDREKFVSDPQRVQAALDTILEETPEKHMRAYDMRHAILHLMFPDQYERIISTRDKQQIVNKYNSMIASDLNGEEDLDTHLQLLRTKFEAHPEYHDGFDFYKLKAEWRSKEAKEDSVDVGEELPRVKEDGKEFLPPADQMKPLKNVWIFQANPQIYNLVEELRTAEVGGQDDWTVSRYREQMNPGDNIILWQAGQNAGIYAAGTLTSEPFDRGEVPKWREARGGDPQRTEWAVRYQYSQILQEPIRKETLLEHPVLRNLQILRAPQGTNFKMTQQEWDAIQDIISQSPLRPHVAIQPEYPLAQCARDSGFDEAMLDRWARAIERKGQAIIFGPPGTGKTYIAELLAKHLIGGADGFQELVQFHPAYAYEDFIQGIRPQAREDGTLHYPVVPGRFLEFCTKSQRRQGRCVLIIDEINRANLARVFGELMYLLEYRKQLVPLAGGGHFKIPDNVRIIGTMNTADRSIALVDHALRRRFAFLSLYPNYDVLRRYHEQTDFPVDGLIETLHRLNTQIGDRHYEVGISFFLRDDLTEHLEDIWRMEIEPYIEEYFFDQRAKVDDFRWDKIRGKVLP